MSLYNDTMYILKKYNLTANKKLGQNFLINEEVAQSIINSANISKEDLVIEIGPGLGTLTNELLQNAGKVIAIELDDRMLKILDDRFSIYNNFEVIHNDVLKVDLKQLILEEKCKNRIEKVKIVANLPYYITTPIIMKLLEEKLDIESITVMIQKEVAERITALPGEKLSGAITYSTYYYAKPESIMIVPNTSFIPQPEVESEVINLKIRKEPIVNVKNENLFFKVIKSSFMQRRKTLINGLSNNNLASKEDIVKILNELEINDKVRGENLTLEQFAKISDMIGEL